MGRAGYIIVALILWAEWANGATGVVGTPTFNAHVTAQQSQYSAARQAFRLYSTNRAAEENADLKLTYGQFMALNGATTPSVSNPIATMIDITATNAGATALHGISTLGTIAWTDTSPDRTLTVSGISYYYKGTLVSNVSDTVQIPATTGLWFLSFDDTTGNLTASHDAWDLYTQIPVATVHWNGTSGAAVNERHGLRDISFHAMLHYSVGARYGSGMSMIAPALNMPSTVSFGSGSIWDEDLQTVIDPSTSVRVWHETAAGVWTWATSNSLYGTTMRYVDTPSYTLTDYTNSQFGVMWVYATPDLSVPIYVIIESRVDPYANIAAARAALPPNLFGTGITPELKLLYRVIFRGDETFTEYTDYRNSSVLPAGGTASSTAASVSFAPYSGMTATNVQTAIEHVDSVAVKLDDSRLSNDRYPTTHEHAIIDGGEF